MRMDIELPPQGFSDMKETNAGLTQLLLRRQRFLSRRWLLGFENGLVRSWSLRDEERGVCWVEREEWDRDRLEVDSTVGR